jgi:hypothetical protein
MSYNPENGQSELTAENIRDTVASLRGANVRPLFVCSDHQPEFTRIKCTRWLRFSCPNCNFGGAVHESAYDDLMKEEE